MIPQWLIIGAFLIMLIFVGGGIGLLVVIIIDGIFEGIVKTPKTIETEKDIKALTDEMKDSEREYALKRLLAESQMYEWWKWVVIIFIAGVVALFLFKSVSYC